MLKPQRNETQFSDILKYCNTTGVRGGIVSLVTAGSGAAYDQSQATVGYVANSSGCRPVGILLCDVVDNDLTRMHQNYLRNEVQVGGKVSIAKKGRFVTSNIIGTPAVGDAAHLTSSGNIMPVTIANSVTVNRVANPYVGTFDSILDEDGFAAVNVDL
jgi:hypothetical protein